MQKNNPLVSILIATYNSEDFIRETLDSVLNQTYTNLEIVLCDDASSDGTVNVLKEYQKKNERIKIIQNDRNLGISLNMNNGIGQCNGKYIAILDADDWAYPYRIEEQVNLMEENPKVVLCSGYMDICDEKLNVTTTRKYPLAN